MQKPNKQLIAVITLFAILFSVLIYAGYYVGLQEGIRRGEDSPVRLEVKNFTVQDYTENFAQCVATFRLSNMREIRLVVANSKDNNSQFVKCSDLKVGENILQPK